MDEIRRLIADLVNGRISDIKRDGRAGRLTAAVITDALARYPGHLSMPPDRAFSNIDAVPIRNSNPPQYYIDFDLWCDGQPSDLTVSFTVTILPSGRVQIALENLHVL
jgi:hypothetical protein